MEDLINNIKKKLSADNLVEMMKDAKVIDEHRIKEVDIRRTLEKLSPDNLLDIDELTAKLNEITEEAAATKETKSSVKLSEKTMTSAFTVLGKASNDNEVIKKGEVEEKQYKLLDNITGFLD